MSEPVMVAVIGAAQVVLAALIGKISFDTRRAKKAAESAEEQVANSHTLPTGETYNLRDNIDHNQAAVMAEFRGMRRDLGRVDSRTIDLGREIGEVRRTLNKHLDDSAEWREEIEDTLNPAKEKP
ncbi:hypothetical protein [Leucobacter massiliensis]|uniref:Uncharacterized protein n=1 Tax=Leucobacter massiliensis TaxID=1686285 RepID=A0A2S9QMU2_9MICO|nr:hypothetical protein [Leucobacter massiliensis]PRI10909.1 hypothetical protein B4915_08470 [Leucobacter massiliensis]